MSIGILVATLGPMAALAGDLPTVEPLQDRLALEIRKMIDAGHLAPGLSLFEQHFRYDTLELGWNLDDYWHNPAELVYTVAIAIPLLPSPLQQEARAYLQSEFDRFPPYEYVHIGREGARRESAPIPPVLGESWPADYGQESEPATRASWPGWSFNPFNVYACFKYAELFPGQAKPLLDRLRDKVQRFPSDSAFLDSHPHVLNVYIAGYYGYLGLQDLVGETRSGSVESWLGEALQARIQALSLDPRDLNGAEAGGFMWLVPELGDFLFSNARERVQQTVDYQNWAAPYWFIARAQESTRVHSARTFSEGYFSHIYEYMSQFQVRAWALKWPQAELEKYLDVPAVARGDLYFIQNLAAAMKAGAPEPEKTITTPRLRASRATQQ